MQICVTTIGALQRNVHHSFAVSRSDEPVKLTHKCTLRTHDEEVALNYLSAFFIIAYFSKFHNEP
jgi:hypothetical protein